MGTIIYKSGNFLACMHSFNSKEFNNVITDDGKHDSVPGAKTVKVEAKKPVPKKEAKKTTPKVVTKSTAKAKT
ncbi:hypothetical protein LPJ81_004286, partial [Coemansia sp. IMI 209127]